MNEEKLTEKKNKMEIKKIEEETIQFVLSLNLWKFGQILFFSFCFWYDSFYYRYHYEEIIVCIQIRSTSLYVCMERFGS